MHHYGLFIPSGSYLCTDVPMKMPMDVTLTWECLVKPPLFSKITMWLLMHRHFAVGFYDTFLVVRMKAQIYLSEKPCATENVVRHWSGHFYSGSEVRPAVFCDGTSIALRRMDETSLLGRVEFCVELPKNSDHLFVGWIHQSYATDKKQVSTTSMVLSDLRLWRAALPSAVLDR
jgi:hypothetical protein